VEKLYLEPLKTCNIQLVWKSYTWNCKEHVIYSLCGKVIPGTSRHNVSTQAVYYMFSTVPGITFPHQLYIVLFFTVPGITFPHKLYITLVWKSYTWNCKEHLKYSFCGKAIPGTVKNM
jgi:hypothetical protein